MSSDLHTAPFHRGWLVAFACSTMLFITMGMNVSAFSFYNPFMVKNLGFSMTQISMIGTMRSLMSLVGIMTVTPLCEKLGLRKTIAAGFLIQIASRIICGLTDSYGVYCTVLALTGLSYSWGGMVPLTILMMRWFRSRRGFAVGIASSGSGLAIILLPGFVNRLESTVGLHATFFAEAGLTAVLSLVALLLIRDDPADVGLEPYYTGDEDSPRSAAKPIPAGMGRTEWALLVLSCFIMGGPMVAGFGHLSVLYSTCGYTTAAIAHILSYMGTVLLFSKALAGALVDKVGGWTSNFILGGAFIGAQILCCLAPGQNSVLPFVAMTLYSIGAPICSVSIATWAQDFSGDENHEQAVRRCNLAYSTGAFAAGPLPGLLADHTGSYVPVYVVFNLMVFLCLLLVQIVYLRTGLHRRRSAR